MRDRIRGGVIHGRVRNYIVPDQLLPRVCAGEHPARLILPTGAWKNNLIMYDWATIVANLLATGNSGYKLGGFYIEFQNVADPGDPVSIPTFDRDEGASYYAALSGSPDTDYLRVPMTAATVSSTDETLYPGGNSVNCFAITTGSAGVHGRPFSDANNSKIFGGAVVAFPDFGDDSQDLIFARFYYETAEQQVKPAAGQIAVEWDIPFA